MACSTYILTFAMLEVFLTSPGSICIDAALLGGMHSVHIFSVNSSLILKQPGNSGQGRKNVPFDFFELRSQWSRL